MSPDPPVAGAATRRMALWLSTIAVVSAALASANVVRILGAQTAPRAALWLGVMLALPAAAVYAAKSRTAAVIWSAAGGVSGFVVIASGSIGVFFAPAALLLFAAGVAASVDQGTGWKTLWILVYLFAGATAMATPTLAVAMWQSSVLSAPGFSQQTKVVPPAAVFWGSAAFVVLAVLLASRAVMRLLRSRTRQSAGD